MAARMSGKAAVVEKLEEIIKNSSYNNFGSRKENDNPNVIGYLNFKSKVTIDGKKRHVRISISLHKNRKTLLKNYDVGFYYKKKGLSSKGSYRLPSIGENKPSIKSKDKQKSNSTPKKPKITYGRTKTAIHKCLSTP